MAVTAIKTTNPLLLAMIAAVVIFVVAARRTAAPWSRSLTFFLRLGLIVIAIRIVVEIVFNQRLPGHVLFVLPHLTLPHWAAGVYIGGPVALEAILEAFLDGLRLAVILVCFGAANSLASPYRLLRCLPAVLYEAGVAVTVALAFAPEIVITIASVREARRLRGRATRGLAGLRGMAIPVLEGALDRSLQLASSMDSRGYGRRDGTNRSTRRRATSATVIGLLAVVVGVYGVLAVGSLFGLGLPILAAGIALCALGLSVGGKRTTRTRYRPDPWRWPEWVVAASGLCALAGLAAAEALGSTSVQFSFYPLAVPGLPVLACVGILVALVPAIAAPAPPATVGPKALGEPATLEPSAVAKAVTFGAAGSRPTVVEGGR
jgi:energy-coupling factor transport system permease protein